jgi:hypothetical protein
MEKGKATAGNRQSLNSPAARRSHRPSQPRTHSVSSSPWRNGKLSAKVKDVPQLDDGASPSLVQWQVLLKSKLTTNADHFATESDRKTHVFACTTGKAAALLETAMAAEDDPDDAFLDWESMVEYLVSSLRNPHEQADARHAYKHLRMEADESFLDFKLQFLQHATRGRIAKSEWKDDLYDKLTKPLQDEMRIEVQKIKDFNEFADLTSGTDSRLKRDRIRAQATIEAKVRTKLRRPTTPPLLPNSPATRRPNTAPPLPRHSTPLPTRQISEQRETTTPAPAALTCYNCGKPGHIRPECPHPKRDADLNEIVEQEEESEDYSELSGNGSA